MTYYNRLKSGVESHYVCPDISVFLHVFSMNKHCTASIATELVFQWLTLQCLSFHMIFHGLLIATHNVNNHVILKHIQVIITSNVKTTNIQRNYVVIYLEIQTSIISLQGGSTWEDRLWLGAEGSALDYPGCFLSCYFPTRFFSVGNFGLGLSRIILVECSDLLGWTEWRYTYVGSIKRSVWRDGYMKNCTKLWVLCCSFNSKIDQEFPSNSTPRKDIGHKAFCIFHHLPLCLIRENASRSLCIRNSCPLTSMPSYLDPGAKREEDCSD